MALAAIVLVVTLLAFANVPYTAAIPKKVIKRRDLPPNSALRIGVKKRPKKCHLKSKYGDTLRVHYNGTLYSDGKQFDCSIDREEPFEFVLGGGEVMEGWEKGLHGMCAKEKRKLVIPSDMAYGEAGGAGTDAPIPPGATLVFDVELLRIVSGQSRNR